MATKRQWCFLLVASLALTACPKQPDVNRNLFLDDNPPPDLQEYDVTESSLFIESRVARLNAEQFFDRAFEPTSNEPTRYNLFNNLVLDVYAQRYAPMGTGTVIWNGVADDGSSFRISFSVNDRTIQGEVRTSTDTIWITPMRDDWHRIDRYDPEGFPEEAEPLVPLVESDAESNAAPPIQCDDPGLPTPPPGKIPTTVRILIAFTPEAAAAGQDVNGTADWLMGQVSDVWTASRFTPIRPELAHVAVLASPEAGNSLADLQRIQRSGDGYYDEVHSLRNQYRADLVALITNQMSDACGRGYYLYPASASSAAWAFTVTQRTCALAQMTFVHELGHNLGMQHDRQSSGSNPALYNYGYIDHGARLRSVMAYNSPCNTQGYYCRRFPTYSNPHDIVYKGSVLGRAIGSSGAAHNRNMLCNNAPVVSKFRP